MAAGARTIYYAAMSLDGFIADLDENLEWLTAFDGPGYAGEAESCPGHDPLHDVRKTKITTTTAAQECDLPINCRRDRP